MSAETGSGDQGPPRAVPGSIDAFDAAWQATVGSIAAARRQPGDGGAGAVGVTVLTGFLGSGKTTVLRQLLSEPAGLRIAAVVNDIGPVNIDAAAIEGLPVASRTPDRVELTNGCACCALVDDLAETLEGLAGARTSDAIVVEASGVANPATIAAVVAGTASCRLDGIIAVADGSQVGSQLDDPRIGPAVCRQIDAAHLVVLSKADLIDAAQLDAVRVRIGELAPGRMVIPAAHGQIDPRILLSAATRGATLGTVDHGHPFQVATATVRPAGPWAPSVVGRWFEHRSEPLLRAKGWFVGPDGRRYELQAVGRSWRIERASGTQDPIIVLIGAAQDAVDRAADSLNRSANTAAVDTVAIDSC